MKLFVTNHVPPFMNFFFIYEKKINKRKEIIYGDSHLGGGLSFAT